VDVAELYELSWSCSSLCQHPVIIIPRTLNTSAHHKLAYYHQINCVIWHIDILERSEITVKVIVNSVDVIYINFLGVVKL
jgi:hypothetical protein